jgi:hypothetical protein
MKSTLPFANIPASTRLAILHRSGLPRHMRHASHDHGSKQLHLPCIPQLLVRRLTVVLFCRIRLHLGRSTPCPNVTLRPEGKSNYTKSKRQIYSVHLSITTASFTPNDVGSVHPNLNPTFGTEASGGAEYQDTPPQPDACSLCSNRGLELNPQSDLTRTVTGIFRRLGRSKHTK